MIRGYRTRSSWFFIALIIERDGLSKNVQDAQHCLEVPMQPLSEDRQICYLPFHAQWNNAPVTDPTFPPFIAGCNEECEVSSCRRFFREAIGELPRGFCSNSLARFKLHETGKRVWRPQSRFWSSLLWSALGELVLMRTRFNTWKMKVCSTRVPWYPR